jgi:hypothetical protein
MKDIRRVRPDTIYDLGPCARLVKSGGAGYDCPRLASAIARRISDVLEDKDRLTQKPLISPATDLEHRHSPSGSKDEDKNVLGAANPASEYPVAGVAIDVSNAYSLALLAGEHKIEINDERLKGHFVRCAL